METTTFDDDGDLELLLQNDDNPTDPSSAKPTPTKKFVVSSKVLCLVSPVWKTMLSGKFLEGTSRQIPLPEDNARALEYMLNLVHFNFDRLKAPTTSDLTHIAIVCDKYDMAGLCRFQANEWKDVFRREGKLYSFDAIFFAWTFGFRSWFESVVKDSITGQTIPRLREYELENFAPPGIAVTMREIATRAHDETFNAIFNTYKRFLGDQSCTIGSAECSAYNLGAFITILDRNSICIDMSLARAVYGTPGPLRPLADVVGGMQISKLPLKPRGETPQRRYGEAEPDEHAQCRSLAGLKDEVKKIMSNIPTALQEHHKVHLRSQAKKVGAE
ncbi:hypothetical protein NA57DRAFT_77618 [Rhizodiscina lignyota]|uniref:BTB domain-containing protein n=1 Tax=Rhizodiscina lignyota TaxID=1504668 RepID=A0A9P4M445_9PEZI|nr:hypothetical protein NA57DRAFT_77618 [Rhizodiscina lignyota]